MEGKFRRSQYITDISLQLRYMIVTFLILLVFFGFSIFVVYKTGGVYLVERLSQVYPQGRLVEILHLIYMRLALGFLLVLPVAFLITLFLSHTVAGPLVRIKRYLKLMAKGEFDLAPLKLRPYDELKDVAELVNQVTAQLGPRVNERRQLVKSLQETVHVLRNDLARMPSAGQEIHRKVSYVADTLKMLE